LITIRKAELRDVPAIHQLINHYAAERILLPRTLTDLYENVWEFTVAEQDGRLLACGSLKFYNQEIAEVRSLCVDVAAKSNRIGWRITETLLNEAEYFGLRTVFALTVAPEFFEKLGFREVARERFPSKVWRDCIQCEKYFACDERAMALELASRHASQVDSPAEATEVSS
jgi:amino-acid N-acetyltransferase